MLSQVGDPNKENNKVEGVKWELGILKTSSWNQNRIQKHVIAVRLRTEEHGKRSSFHDGA